MLRVMARQLHDASQYDWHHGAVDKLCNLIDKLEGNVVTVGDFNLPGIDWTRNFSNSAGEQVFLDVLAKKFWSQHVNFATHKDGNLIDLFTSSRPDLICEVRDEGHLGGSDHTMVWAELIGPARDQDSGEMVPDWRCADMESLKKSLSEINWEEKLDGKTGIESWDIFKSILKEETDRCVPKKKRRTSSKPVWMNRNVLRLIRKKR